MDGSAAVTAVTASDLGNIVTTLQSQITVANILGVLGAGLAVAVTLGFMWWGGRKLVSIIMSAFRKGKVRV